jgi:gamma-glutamylputrescine oxidase
MKTSGIELRPWYWADGPEPARRPPLAGDLQADVCIVGAGIAGCSAALHLAEIGYRVVVLEAEQVGWGASGRSGAQAIFGVAASQEKLEALVGAADARAIWDVSVAGLALQRGLIARHGIDCDYVAGQLHVAIKARQEAELRNWHEDLHGRYGYTSVSLVERDALPAFVGSKRYRFGLHDSNSGHLQPLKYVRGLATAAERQGARIHERTRALSYTQQAEGVNVHTASGTVHARQLLLAGNAWLGDMVPQLARRIMGVSTYVVATQVLGEARASALLPRNSAVTDINWVLDYFRRSSDHRLLFGGRVSYSGLDPFNTAEATRRRMLAVFPQLGDVRITHAWGGYVDITMNRAPDFGRLSRDVYYLQGFSGHGIALTGIAGKLVAEAIAGTNSHFDVFARIPHREVPGGLLLRRPALVRAMLWYRLRDLL